MAIAYSMDKVKNLKIHGSNIKYMYVWIHIQPNLASLVIQVEWWKVWTTHRVIPRSCPINLHGYSITWYDKWTTLILSQLFICAAFSDQGQSSDWMLCPNGVSDSYDSLLLYAVPRSRDFTAMHIFISDLRWIIRYSERWVAVWRM